MGMAVFFIFYGLAETINAIYVYLTKKEWFNLIATTFWGLSFILVGEIEILQLNNLKNIAYIIYGFAWLPMLFTPCAIKILRKNKWTLLLRKFIFLIIAICELAIVFWK
jgi:hypothetical protein